MKTQKLYALVDIANKRLVDGTSLYKNTQDAGSDAELILVDDCDQEYPEGIVVCEIKPMVLVRNYGIVKKNL